MTAPTFPSDPCLRAALDAYAECVAAAVLREIREEREAALATEQEKTAA